MTGIEVRSVCEEGYTVVSRIGDWELTVDAAGEDGPTANQVLVANYASCFVPAMRVGAEKRGVEDLGRVEVSGDADLDDDDDIEAIRFHVETEADVGDDTMDEILDRAKDICHVHATLREGVRADLSYDTGAL